MEIITIAPKAKRSGMIMPLVATIVVFIFLIGIAMLKIGFGSRFIAARTSSEIAARSAADAGLTMAMHLMTPGISPYPVGETEMQYTRDTYSYEVTEATSGPVGSFLICSTGKSRKSDYQISRTVYAMTWATSFWSYAIAVEDSISFKSKTVVGVWPEDSDFTPDIRTSSTDEGDVWLAPNTELPGDVVIGPGGDPESVVQVKSSSVINGDTYAADTVIEFPPVTIDFELPPLVAWDPCSPEAEEIGEGLYAYSSIDLGTSDRVDITGNVVMYVAGLMRLHHGTVLNIRADSSLTLYLGGSLIADQDADIRNETSDARNLRLYGLETCTAIQIKNSGEFWGAVYAPSADLQIYNRGTTYGSFIGESFEMGNSAKFYYDVRLYDFDPTGDLSFFRIERWWERGDDSI